MLAAHEQVERVLVLAETAAGLDDLLERTATPGGAEAVRAATWSGQCPPTITTRRTPTAWSASSIQARIGRPPTRRSAVWVWSVRGARRRATPAARMTAVTPVSGMSKVR